MSNSAEQRSPDTVAIATASAAAAAALHGDDVREEVYAVVEASLEADLARVRRLNAVRSRFGRPELGLRILGLWHDCFGSRKPIPDPSRPGEFFYDRYWTCDKLMDGCYYCRYVEITEVAA